jgi:aspartyl-tRNA(Asn)/glutamyl-tRNA(Gln) amidotransferase subunit A
VALGSDTGGSIRQPAAFCGVVGLKPTYGLVSRYGLVAYASSLDQIGPIARSVADAAAVLNVIAGHDPLDSTSFPGPYPDYTAQIDRPVENLRLGVARQYMSQSNSPDVRRVVEGAIERFRTNGATIVEVDLPHTEYGIPTYYLVATAEASSNLARFDGVHFGHRTARPSDLADLYSASRAEGFGPEVKRRIMLGTYALSSGYYDEYYGRAQRVRTKIADDFRSAFEAVDFVVTPTSPTVAFPLGAKTDDPFEMYLNDYCTVPMPLAGIPAISIPNGLSAGLPVGLQLTGPAFSENRLLDAAHAFERAIGFDGSGARA